MSKKVLIVEDEQDIRNLLEYNLAKAGYSASSVESGEDALQIIQKQAWDLVLLDLMLPGMSGLDVCRALQEKLQSKHIAQIPPIIIVSARGEEQDIVRGLEMGAEDYVVKPFSLRVLLARVKRVLSRHDTSDVFSEKKGIDHRGIRIDDNRHEVHIDGEKIDLTSSEFRLLRVLVERPGWVFTRNQIVCAVHGDDYPVTSRSVDVMVLGLRRKMGNAGALIETVRGVGYRFAE